MFAPYRRPPPSLKILRDPRLHNLYSFIYNFSYEWSTKLNQTLLFAHGVLNDDNYTPVMFQLAGFMPYFMITFPTYYNDEAQAHFLGKLDGILRNHLAHAVTENSATGILAKQLFRIPSNRYNPNANNNNNDQKSRKRKFDEFARAQQQEADDDDIGQDEFAAAEDQQHEDEFATLDKSRLRDPDYIVGYAKNSTVPLIINYVEERRLPNEGYTPKPYKMWRINLVHPRLVVELREIIYKLNSEIHIYDATVDFSLRYLADMHYKPASWFRLTHGKYKRLFKEKEDGKKCKPGILEYMVPNHLDFRMLDTIDERTFLQTIDLDEQKEFGGAIDAPKDLARVWQGFVTRRNKYKSVTPNFLQLTFDIECTHPKTKFPDENVNPCILITVELYRIFNQQPDKTKKVAFSLGSVIIPTDPKKRVCDQVFAYKLEKDMLAGFHDFIVESDPDVICGHNSNGFDFKYLFKRAELREVQNFRTIGRSLRGKVKHERETTNKGFKKSLLSIDGRMNFDLYRYHQDTYSQAKSHTLNSLAINYLKETKIDFPHELTEKYHQTPQGRTTILEYGMKDTDLTRRIASKIMGLENTLATCNINGINFQSCLHRGQGAKLEALIYQAMNHDHEVYYYDTPEDMHAPNHLELRRVVKTKYSLRWIRKEYDAFGAPPAKTAKTEKDSDEPKERKKADKAFVRLVKSVANKKSQGTLDGFLKKAEPVAEAKPENDEDDEEEEKDMIDDDDDDDENGEEDDDVEMSTMEKLEKNVAEYMSSNSGNTAASEETDENGNLVKDDNKGKNSRGYKGATVLKTVGGFFGFVNYDKAAKNWDPKIGVYIDHDENPVITLDFSGMYPSIMRRYNLGHTTFLTQETIDFWKLIEGVHYWRKPALVEDKKTGELREEPDPNGHAFVLPSLRKALMVIIQEDLAATRAEIRDVHKEAVDTQANAIRLELVNKWPGGIAGSFASDKIINSQVIQGKVEMLMKSKNAPENDAEREAFKGDIMAKISQLANLEQQSANLDLKQIKVKEGQNSIYGLTGDKTSKFCLYPIAMTITGCGRFQIYTIKTTAERDFRIGSPKYPDCPFDSHIVFGDTDSVAVELKGMGMKWMSAEKLKNDKYRKLEVRSIRHLEGAPELTLTDAFEWGMKMAKEITKLFERPCKLEFEKVLVNLINIKAKNYVALRALAAPHELEYKMFVKGITIKKRKFPAYFRDGGAALLEEACVRSNPLNSVELSRDMMQKFFDNQVSICALTFTEKISRHPDQYRVVTPAVAISRRRMAKDPTDKIDAGEFIQYVIANHQRMNFNKQKKKPKRSEQAVEAWEAMSEQIPLDIPYYKTAMDKQMCRMLHYPLRKLLNAKYKEEEEQERKKKEEEEKKKKEEEEKKKKESENDETREHKHKKKRKHREVEEDEEKEKKEQEGEKKRKTYCTLDFSDDNDDIILAAFVDYFYNSPKINLTNVYAAPVTESETKNKRSIAHYFKVKACVACGKSIPDESNKLCDGCRDGLPQKFAELEEKQKSSQKDLDSIWGKCSKCMNGQLEEAKLCRNMSCVTRGDRDIAERNLKKINERLHDIEDIWKFMK